MQMSIQQGNVQTFWSTHLAAGIIGMSWLGQAGWVIRSDHTRVIIDPYLSNSLAVKYRDKEFPHIRMMPPPIATEQLTDVDYVLCSHRHTDHMDPGTLPILAKVNPTCRFVVPRAETATAVNAGIPAERVIAINAGETLSLAEDLVLSAIASAHEEIKMNNAGEHHFLGFILQYPQATLYHSGDTVVYPELTQRLWTRHIDLALLPVNGRDQFRTDRGIPGNMTFDEACKLCVDAQIPLFVAHHFGMFDFNTVARDELLAAAAACQGVRCIVPDVHYWYQLQARSKV